MKDVFLAAQFVSESLEDVDVVFLKAFFDPDDLLIPKRVLGQSIVGYWRLGLIE